MKVSGIEKTDIVGSNNRAGRLRSQIDGRLYILFFSSLAGSLQLKIKITLKSFPEPVKLLLGSSMLASQQAHSNAATRSP